MTLYENQKLISPKVRYNKDVESVELPDLGAKELVRLEKFKQWARKKFTTFVRCCYRRRKRHYRCRLSHTFGFKARNKI